MALLPALTQYYRIDFKIIDSGGGESAVSLCVAHPIYFNGDGSELGGGWKSGAEQLRAVADGLAAGLQDGNSPGWVTVTVSQISAQPQGPTVVYTAT